MLNEKSVREQLADVRGALGKLDAEHTALKSIESSLLRWLDLHSDAGGAQLPLQAAIPPANGKTTHRTVVRDPGKPLFEKLGAVSLKVAVDRALRNREGQVMSSYEILSTVQEIGARTNAKDPIKVIEWILYDMIKKGRPVRRVQAHHYVWEAPPSSPHRPSLAYPQVFDK